MKASFSVPDRRAAKAFLQSFDSPTQTRGKQAHANGAIRNLSCAVAGSHYTAKAHGSQIYDTSLFYEDGYWESECSCPVGIDCKHAYAAMLALLDLPDPVLFSKLSPVPVAAVAGLEQKLADALQRKLRPPERHFTKKIHDLFVQCRATGAITGWEVQSLGLGSFGNTWERLSLWPAFPKDELDFWIYLAYAFTERRIPIPEFMQAITDFGRIENVMRDWKRQIAITRWQRQLQDIALRPTATGSGAIDFRLRLGAQEASLEWKLANEPDFQPLKQGQLKRFSDDYISGNLEIIPEAFPLWHFLQQRWDYQRHLKLDLSYPDVARALNHLLRMASFQERVITETGALFARPAETLRWQLQPAATEKDDYLLRLTLPDGAPPPLIRLTLPGRPTLYVTADAIYAGPPPCDQALDATQTNLVPAPALETRQGLDFLLRLGLELPPRLQERTQRVGMKVKIFCDLKPLYPGSESEAIFVRVEADTELGRHREKFTINGWQIFAEQPESKPQAKDETFYVHDRAGLDAVPGLLEPLRLNWDHYQQCWRLRAAKNFPEKFVPWLESLPKSIEVHLDKQLATLTEGPVSAFVKLDCEAAGVDWFDLKVVLDVSDTDLTPEELKILLDARGRYVRLGKKGWRRLQFNLTDEEDARLAQLGLSPHDFSSEPQRLHALQLSDDAAARMLPEHQAEIIQRRVGELKTRVTPPVPDNIRAQLRPYQIEGFHFLAYLSTNRFGGILADDMGLGKTLQALAWLAWLRAQPEAGNRPNLVVCPKSVMDNWCAEAGRFLPGLRVKIWRGTDPSALKEALAEADLFVINYTQLRVLGLDLANIVWHSIILDEGQYIKNPESQTAQVARALKADHRLALSGTPIENRLLDLWSLMAFAMPGVLGNRRQFSKRFDQAEDVLARRRLAARVRPFLLRRTKLQVASELPDRIEEDLLCELEGEQKTLYRAEFKRAQQMLLKIKTRQELNEQRFNFLTSLLRLRQICCHPALIQPEAIAQESAKVSALLELLEPLMAEGNKVLVFSQFVSMLEILKQAMTAQNWPHFYLAGETENRGELVERFQSAPGPAVFLISLKAGGFGLNLTAASYVVLFDPWWNPAVENQAIDRTHRIGQTSKVIAYRLLIKNSIEEKIRALQRTKSALAQDVLGEESFTKSLTLEDLHFLFADDAEPVGS
jgi:hypothetical protein